MSYLTSNVKKNLTDSLMIKKFKEQNKMPLSLGPNQVLYQNEGPNFVT